MSSFEVLVRVGVVDDDDHAFHTYNSQSKH